MSEEIQRDIGSDSSEHELSDYEFIMDIDQYNGIQSSEEEIDTEDDEIKTIDQLMELIEIDDDDDDDYEELDDSYGADGSDSSSIIYEPDLCEEMENNIVVVTTNPQVEQLQKVADLEQDKL